MNYIAIQQKKIINNCKKYLQDLKKKNIDTSTSPLCYFTAWAETPGKYKLFELSGIASFKKFFFLKNLALIAYYNDLSIFSNSQKIKKIDNLIISYCTRECFDKNYNFYDASFDYNNIDNNNYAWLLISLDNYIPKKINKNINIIAKKNKNSFSLIYLVKSLLRVFLKTRFSKDYIIHEIWSEKIYSSKIRYIFHNFFKNIKVKNLILNYENIPFQNEILKEAKVLNSKIKTFGYLHCAPWPLQTDFFYRDQPIDNLVVSSFDQKKNLNKFFLWKKKKIFVIPSLRFIKNKRKIYNNTLFVPYNLKRKNNFLERFENFLSNLENFSIKKFIVKIHPLNKNSKLHKKFKLKLENILIKWRKKFNSHGKNLSIFFGSATGVCVQALEEGSSIIHFPENEIIDVFTPKIWPNINVKKLENNVFLYNIKKKEKLFYTVNKKNRFKFFFIPLIEKYGFKK